MSVSSNSLSAAPMSRPKIAVERPVVTGIQLRLIRSTNDARTVDAVVSDVVQRGRNESPRSCFPSICFLSRPGLSPGWLEAPSYEAFPGFLIQHPVTRLYLLCPDLVAPLSLGSPVPLYALRRPAAVPLTVFNRRPLLWRGIGGSAAPRTRCGIYARARLRRARPFSNRTRFSGTHVATHARGRSDLCIRPLGVRLHRRRRALLCSSLVVERVFPRCGSPFHSSVAAAVRQLPTRIRDRSPHRTGVLRARSCR